jgi:tellurite resistance protein TehA-like permease
MVTFNQNVTLVWLFRLLTVINGTIKKESFTVRDVDPLGYEQFLSTTTITMMTLVLD